MKKAIFGVAAVGAAVGLRPLAKRVSKRMRAHCGAMAAQCMQIAGQVAGRHEPVGRT